jgi:hypothetical protein
MGRRQYRRVRRFFIGTSVCRLGEISMASGQWAGGKGSTQRKVDKQKFSDNWDAIFGKKNDINSVSDNEGTLDGDSKEETQEEGTADS